MAAFWCPLGSCERPFCWRERTGQVETRLGNRQNLKWYLGLSAQRKGQNCCGTCLLGRRLSLPIIGQKVAGTRHFVRNYFLTYQLYRLGGGGKGIRTLDTVARILVFETSAFNHSATCPVRICSRVVQNGLVFLSKAGLRQWATCPIPYFLDPGRRLIRS